MKTKILKIDPIEPNKAAIGEAADIIKGGGLVVFPTESVYGIGADAFNAKACSDIFKVKGRPSDNPLIVTVASLDQAMEIGDIPGDYLDSIKRVWPCPLTFIVKNITDLPEEVTAGLDTVALRMPAHPVALELIRESGTPIAAPSANLSKKPTAVNAQQALRYFDGKVDCIIDSGPAFFGLESTIIDLRTFQLLRPGPFTIDELEKAFGKRPDPGDVARGSRQADVAIAPGTKYAHYAPDTKLFLYEGDVEDLSKSMRAIEIPQFAFIGSNESCQVMHMTGCQTMALGKRGRPYEIAKGLYDGLIALDSAKVGFGIIESFAEDGIGLAIMNRIRKASSNNTFRSLDGLLGMLQENGLYLDAHSVSRSE